MLERSITRKKDSLSNSKSMAPNKDIEDAVKEINAEYNKNKGNTDPDKSGEEPKDNQSDDIIVNQIHRPREIDFDDADNLDLGEGEGVFQPNNNNDDNSLDSAHPFARNFESNIDQKMSIFAQESKRRKQKQNEFR